MLEITKLRWKNFLSYGDVYTEFVFNSDTTLIVGQNSSGKSTLCDALCFVLYGKPFRNVNKPHLVNVQNGKECVVELHMKTNGKQYCIVRGIKPNVFEVWENEKQIHFTADSRDFQTIFETQILQMSYKAFTQIVILGKANYSPFMTLSPADKRKVIEDLLDLGVFSLMNKYLAEEKISNKEQIRDIESKLSLAYVEKTEKQKAYDRMLSYSASVQEKLRNDIIKARTDLAIATEEKNKVDSEYEVIQKEKKVYEEQRQKHARIVSEIETREKKLVTLATSLSSICPACGQKKDIQITDDQLQKLETSKQQLTNSISVLKQALPSLCEAISGFDTDRVQAAINTCFEAKHRYNYLTHSLITLEAEERDQTGIENTVDLLLELDGVNKQIDLHLETVKNLTAVKDVIDIAGGMLKDGGIKQKIITRYIPVMNAGIQKYLNAFNLPIQFSIADDFSENILSADMANLGYNSFSEGQKARIELAVLFAWRDIAKERNSSATNILILDEVFDGSLDIDGNEDLMGVIDQFPSSQIIVISHKPEAYADKFKRVLHVSKKAGFSEMVEGII